MPNSLRSTVISEDPNACTCRAPKSPTKASNLRLVGISIPQPKLRIKMPRLMRTLRRDNGGESEKSRAGPRPRNLLPKRVGLAMGSVFSGKKSPEKPAGGNDGVPGEVGAGGTGDSGISRQSKKSGLLFSGILWRRNALGFDLKGKGAKPSSGGSGSSRLARAGSRNMMARARSEPKTVAAEGGEGGEGDDELCKKRILMGERCRPLNRSGALHYDQNGVLLPEEVH